MPYRFNVVAGEAELEAIIRSSIHDSELQKTLDGKGRIHVIKVAVVRYKKTQGVDDELEMLFLKRRQDAGVNQGNFELIPARMGETLRDFARTISFSVYLATGLEAIRASIYRCRDWGFQPVQTPPNYPIQVVHLGICVVVEVKECSPLRVDPSRHDMGLWCPQSVVTSRNWQVARREKDMVVGLFGPEHLRPSLYDHLGTLDFPTNRQA